MAHEGSWHISEQVPAGYPTSSLRRALEAALRHPDPDVRNRAVAKVDTWRRVLDGIADESIEIGSRAPVADTPAWVTLEVAHGGFATGRYLAEQPLRPDEAAVAADRERLNLHFLGDDGQAVLRDALASGRFRIDLPEDAALPVVAWLLEHEHWAEALDLVAELRPLMHRLRFTPAFDTASRPASGTVRRATAHDAAASLRAVTTPGQIEVMRTTLGVWNPLFDELVQLWAETVDGDPPRVGEDGTVVGGWPCRRTPDDWARRRVRWLTDCLETAARHPMSRRQESPKSDFARLRHALERCPHDSSRLTGRQVGWIRRALANTTTRHGAPGSPERLALRAEQTTVATAPTFAAIADVLAARLDGFPADAGIGDLDSATAPVSTGVPGGTPVPAPLVDRVARALEAPVAELVERRIVPSGEVLATLLPQITAGILAADLGDPALSEVHRQAYAAFRRRRSLLLLDLQSQVRFEELPWVAAVSHLRRARPDVAAAAHRTLRETVLLTLHAFPHTITPNALVGELGRLAQRAGLSLPLVSEVAADIFTGRFTDTWRRAAAEASDLLTGTLYARYYDLPAASTWAEPILRRRPWAVPADGFAAVCAERAREAGVGGTRSVAANGAVLEQSQILTTHNLAVLAAGLDLVGEVADLAPAAATTALDHVVRTLARPAPSRHARLIAVKNAAYAWRQAVFLLSFTEQAEQEAAVARLHDHALPAAFGQLVDGLEHAVHGATLTGGRFLGWSVGPHPLVPA